MGHRQGAKKKHKTKIEIFEQYVTLNKYSVSEKKLHLQLWVKLN